MKAIEFFCGIGGFAYAAGNRFQQVLGIDIHTTALEVYRANHRHAIRTATIESLQANDLRDDASDFWWLSPPCRHHLANPLRNEESNLIWTIIAPLLCCG